MNCSTVLHNNSHTISLAGHVGQSNLYSRMCEKAKTLGSYRVETQPHEVCEESADMYAISLELRRQTLCAEGVMSDDQDEFEGSSRCLVGYRKSTGLSITPSSFPFTPAFYCSLTHFTFWADLIRSD